MSDIAISVENISKRYRIGLKQEMHNTFGSALADLAMSPIKNFRRIRQFSKFSKNGHEADDVIWALKDVSFEVERGEVVGIIGRNGAGKSTLLKILTRITEPTSGRAVARGRVASLLEVGTGFHPELTGRENVYLNGAILGMHRKEIDRKFDEIVEFSGVEKFIDTPVKRYSSGMKVRLAFGVAAHLEPEILLIDEVLAVGDVEFQRKCLGKMQDVVRGGRTILFVSHNMGAVKSLCNRAILFDGGQVAYDGNVDQVVDTYLMAGARMFEAGIIPDNATRIGSGEVKIRSVELTNPEGDSVSQLYLGQPFRVTLTLETLTEMRDAVVEVGISSIDGVRLLSSFTTDDEQPPVMLMKGCHRVCLDLQPVLLPRSYTLDVGVHHVSGATADFVERVFDFTVANVATNSGDRYPGGTVRGFVRPTGQWYLPEVIGVP